MALSHGGNQGVSAHHASWCDDSHTHTHIEALFWLEKYFLPTVQTTHVVSQINCHSHTERHIQTHVHSPHTHIGDYSLSQWAQPILHRPSHSLKPLPQTQAHADGRELDGWSGSVER